MHLKWMYKTIQDKTMWIPLTWARKKKVAGGLTWLRLRASGWQANMNTQY